MNRLAPILVLLGLVAACGSPPPPAPVDSSAIVVPTQPPQPSAAPATPIAPVAAPIAFSCEGGKRFEVGPRSYCGYADPAPWDAAERRCVAHGGHLATIDSKGTSDALHKALGSPVGAGRAAWIGLELGKSKTNKPAWTWITGDTVGASSWNDGEPNNYDNNEACGEWLVADGRWNDTRCTLKQPFVCRGKGDKTLACAKGQRLVAGGAAYCFNTTDKTYPDAKRQCTADGGELAVLRTTEENNALRDAMASKFAAPKMWIGANDGDQEGTWTWTSGAPFDVAFWLPGEPNDFNRENCAELHADTWQWNDFDCGALLPSLCESPLKKK